MKKSRQLLPAFFVLLLMFLLAFCATAQATQTVDVAFDGVRIPVSQVPGGPPADGSAYTPFYLDVSAETVNNRTFVPLRLLSELLGAKVVWQAPNVLLTYGETTLILTPGSKQASKNQSQITLDAAPYTKNGRTMVPIRFIMESFQCQVDFTKKLVNIKTPPLFIENQNITKMTTQNISPEYINHFELKANLFIKNIYQTVFQNHGQEVDEPEFYGDYVNIDPLVYYWSGNDSYSLLDGNDKIVKQFTIYEAGGNGGPHPEGTSKYLLFDVTAKKWYSLSESVYSQMQRWNWTATRYGAEGYSTAWRWLEK